MKFPREVWSGSHIRGAPQVKRQIVKNKQEFLQWLNSHNGIANCYTTVYDFEDFVRNKHGQLNIKVESSVILDRMFLDFDAHDEPLSSAYDDCYKIFTKFLEEEIKFECYFSGKGFHIIAYGERANDIRSIQEYYSSLAKDCPTLDRTGIQANRLRRIPFSLNLSTVTEDMSGYYCLPFVPFQDDSTKDIKLLLQKASDSSHVNMIHDKQWGSKLIKWPAVKSIELSETLIELPEAIGRIPIIPCLQNAITVENPSHMSRVYLVQWYRDLLSLGVRKTTPEKEQEIINLIMTELKHISSKPEIWLDWDEPVTRKNVEWIVKKGYHAPGCKNVLIPNGFCIGKCWRYHE